MNGLSDKSHATDGFIQFLFHSELSVSHSKLAWLNDILRFKRFNRNKTVTFISIQSVSSKPYRTYFVINSIA